MKKSVKTLIAIGAGLAIMDISDMVAKGQMLNAVNVLNPDTATELRDMMGTSLRPKIILKMEKQFKWITDHFRVV